MSGREERREDGAWRARRRGELEIKPAPSEIHRAPQPSTAVHAPRASLPCTNRSAPHTGAGRARGRGSAVCGREARRTAVVRRSSRGGGLLLADAPHPLPGPCAPVASGHLRLIHTFSLMDRVVSRSRAGVRAHSGRPIRTLESSSVVRRPPTADSGATTGPSGPRASTRAVYTSNHPTPGSRTRERKRSKMEMAR